MSSTDPLAAGAALLARTLAALEAELDWELLGRAACEGDGSGFFDGELRARAVDTGLVLFDALATALPAAGPGRSMYVGASVAELAPMLAEQLVLGREVRWCELEGPATRELARAVGVVARRAGLELAAPVTMPLERLPVSGCDHLWLVSVLSDPEAFPALHDELYERAGGPLATGRGDLERERARAEGLLDALFAHAAERAVFTTTEEELVLAVPRAARAGLRIDVPAAATLSAVVGDPVRVCRIERSVG